MPALVLGAVVELGDELADVDAVLAERGPTGGAGVACRRDTAA